MSTHTDSTGAQEPETPGLRQDTLQDYQNDSTTIPLPDINMAIHPSQVCFGDDINDKDMFNDRFIESRVHEGMNVFILCLAAMMHNVMFVSILSGLIYTIKTDSLNLILTIGFLIGYIISFLGPYFAFKIASTTPIRFNSQAQRFTTLLINQQVISLPWREAMPHMPLGRVASRVY